MNKDQQENLLEKKGTFLEQLASVKKEQVKILTDIQNKVSKNLRDLINESVPFINNDYGVSIAEGPLVGYENNMTLYYDPIDELYRVTEKENYYATAEDVVNMGLFTDACKALNDSDKYLKRYNNLLLDTLFKRMNEVNEIVPETYKNESE